MSPPASATWDEAEGQLSHADDMLLHRPWSWEQQQLHEQEQQQGWRLRQKVWQQQQRAAEVQECGLWSLSAFVEGSSRLLPKRSTAGVRADLLQRLLPEQGEGERHVIAAPPKFREQVPGRPAADSVPLFPSFSSAFSSAASAASGVKEHSSCSGRGPAAAAAAGGEGFCAYASGSPLAATPAFSAAAVAVPPLAITVGGVGAALACTLPADAAAEASAAAAHAAASIQPGTSAAAAGATEPLPRVAAAEARAAITDTDTAPTEGGKTLAGGPGAAVAAAAAAPLAGKAAAEGGEARIGGRDAAAVGVDRKENCRLHEALGREGGSQGAVLPVAAVVAAGERQETGDRGLREEGRSRTAAAAAVTTSNTTEARRERQRGGRHLRSRRQSRGIRREAWRKSAILRHFDTQVQPRPHAERLFFPVHALCQAEGYDLNSLYRTLLPRDCHARFLDERNTVLYVQFFDWDLQLSQAKARSYECFSRLRATQKGGAAHSSSFCGGRMPLRRREGERSRCRAAAARGGASRRRCSSDSSSGGRSMRFDEQQQSCQASPPGVIVKAFEEELQEQQEMTPQPIQQQPQLQRGLLTPQPQQHRELAVQKAQRQRALAVQKPQQQGGLAAQQQHHKGFAAQQSRQQQTTTSGQLLRQQQEQTGCLQMMRQQQQQTPYLQVPQQKGQATEMVNYTQKVQQQWLQQKQELRQKHLYSTVEQQQQQRSRLLGGSPCIPQQQETQPPQEEGQQQEGYRKNTGELLSALSSIERKQQQPDCRSCSRSVDARGSACDLREAAAAEAGEEGSHLHRDLDNSEQRMHEKRSSSCGSWRRRRAAGSITHRSSSSSRTVGGGRGSSGSGTETRRSSSSSRNIMEGSRRSHTSLQSWVSSSNRSSSSASCSRSRSNLSSPSHSCSSPSAEAALLQLEQLGRRRRVGWRRRFHVRGVLFGGAYSPASAAARSCLSSNMSLLCTDSGSLFAGEEEGRETELDDCEEAEEEHLQRSRRDAMRSLTFALLPPAHAAATGETPGAPRREAGAAEDASAAAATGARREEGGAAAARGAKGTAAHLLEGRRWTTAERRSREGASGEVAAALLLRPAAAPKAAHEIAAAAAAERAPAAAGATVVLQQEQKQHYESGEQSRGVSSAKGRSQSISEGNSAADGSSFALSSSSLVVSSSTAAAADEVPVTERPSCCFIFANGAVVVWGESQAEATELKREWLSNLLWLLNSSATGLVRADKSQEDVMFYCYIDALFRRFPQGKVPPARVKQNRLYLKTYSAEEKLAVSYALAQSIRLDVYEALVNSTIAQVREIPERMCHGGCSSFTREQSMSSYSTAAADGYRKLFADLAVKMIDVNLVQDFLDVPEIFWDDDTWQPFWQRVHNHLELQDRIDLLNTRYSYILELLNVVRRGRFRAQEFRLTWIVLVLLTAQVVATLLKFVFTSH